MLVASVAAARLFPRTVTDAAPGGDRAVGIVINELFSSNRGQSVGNRAVTDPYMHYLALELCRNPVEPRVSGFRT
jgi:hypothetical protein